MKVVGFTQITEGWVKCQDCGWVIPFTDMALENHCSEKHGGFLGYVVQLMDEAK